MLPTVRVLSICALSVVACGGDDAGTTPDGGGGGDGGATVSISGVAETVEGLNRVPLAAARIEAFNGGGASVATTMSGTDGTYTLALPFDGTPIDGYLKGTSTGRIDTYLYPPRPLTADRTGATMLIITQQTLGLLGTVGGVTQDASKGFVGLVVQNGAGVGVAGATVTISPMGTARILYAANGVPSSTATSTDASGTVFIANTNVGDVTVDATMGGMAFHEHTLNARAGVITTTAIEP